MTHEYKHNIDLKQFETERMNNDKQIGDLIHASYIRELKLTAYARELEERVDTMQKAGDAVCDALGNCGLGYEEIREAWSDA